MPLSLKPPSYHPSEKNTYQRFIQQEHQLWRVDSTFLQSLGLNDSTWLSTPWSIRSNPPRDCQSWNTSRWPPVEGSNVLPCRSHTKTTGWCQVGLVLGESVDMLESGSRKRKSMRDVWAHLLNLATTWYSSVCTSAGNHPHISCHDIDGKPCTCCGKKAVILNHHNSLMFIPESLPRKLLPDAASAPTVISIRNCSIVCLPCFTHLVVWWQIKEVDSNLGGKLKEHSSHTSKCNLIVWGNLMVARNPAPTHHAMDFGCSILHLILMGDVLMLYLLRWCYDSWFDKHVIYYQLLCQMIIPHSPKVEHVRKYHWAPLTNSHSNAATCSLSNLEIKLFKFVSMVETLVRRGFLVLCPSLESSKGWY